MSSKRQCQQCQAQLDAYAPAGLCPRCMIESGLGETEPLEDSEESGTESEPTLRRIGDYELLEPIGRGGMGVVFKARQRSLDRTVAVKMILSGQFSTREIIQRFRAEAAAAAMLQHPNIVAIHEVGMAGGQHFFSMDYVAGQNLAELVREGPLPPRQAAGYVQTIAEAIHYAHQQGILHRDLKPSNVLIDAATDQPRITDFGLARRLESGSELTVSGQVLGSPNYMPPEQADPQRGRLGRFSDVYALGAILYNLLTGRPPFQGSTLEDVILQVLRSDVLSPNALNRAVPRDLETICLKCLEKEPARRYDTAKELADELGRFLNHEPIRARRVSQAEKLWRWSRRKPALSSTLGAVLVLLLVVCLGSPIALYRINQARQTAEAEKLAARQNLYAADMLLAQQSYEQGDVRRALDLLLKHRPKDKDEDLRGFEWRYLWRQCQQGDALRTLREHKATVIGVAWSPNGLLAASSLDGSVTLYDIERNQVVAALHTSEPVSVAGFPPRGGLAFSGDGTLLAIGDAEGGVQLWSANPFRKLKARTFSGPVRTLALSPDAALLALSVEGGGIKIWSLQDDRLLESFPRSERYAIRLSFSSNGQFLAAGGDALPVRIWRAPDFDEVATLENPHSGFSSAVAISPDGHILATGSWDSMIKLWDFRSRTLLATLKGHSSLILDLDFSPDGKLLVSSSGEGTLKLWRLDEPLRAEMTAWRTLRGHTSEASYVCFSPDGEMLASGGPDQTVKLWRVRPAPPRDILAGHQDWAFSVAISADMRRLATGGFDGAIRLWDAEALTCRTIADAHRQNILAVLFSPDGRRLASCDAVWRVNAQHDFRAPGTVKFWDAETGALLASLTNFITGVRAIAISPNGSLLATGDHDGRVRLWNIQNLPPTPMDSIASTEAVPENRAVPRQIRRLEFSSDGKRLAILRQSHAAEVWNIDPLQRHTLILDRKNWALAMTLSPDGRQIAGGHKDVKIWNIDAGNVISSLTGHKATILSAAFSPDGKTLATASVDHSIKLWNLAIQQEVATLKAHDGPVSQVVFSRDGNWLLSASEDKTARIWRAPTFQETE